MSTPPTGASRSRPSIGRSLTVVLGAGVLGYGVLLLAPEPSDTLRRVGIWLAAGVVVHDVVIAGLSILLGAVVLRLPRPVRAPVAVGMVLGAVVAAVSLPAWGRFGAKADNPTLLDVDYRLGAILTVVILVLGVAVSASWRLRRAHRATADGGPAADPRAGREAGEWD